MALTLTTAQATLLRNHINANTNAAAIPGGSGTFVINAAVSGRDPTLQQGMCDWYNGTALAGDNQPFASLFLWNPNTTELLLSTAVDWTTTPPHGLGGSPTVDQQQLAVGNKWWLWDQLIGRKGFIDMTDAQARNGILQVFGNIGPVNTNSTTSSAIGSETINPLVGKLAGRRLELVMNATVVGAKTAWNGAIVCPKDANGALIIGQIIRQTDIDKVLFPNG